MEGERLQINRQGWPKWDGHLGWAGDGRGTECLTWESVRRIRGVSRVRGASVPHVGPRLADPSSEPSWVRLAGGRGEGGLRAADVSETAGPPAFLPICWG